MPIFEVQTPDGKTYEVDAPDQNSALQALEGMNAPRQSPGIMESIDNRVRSLARGVPVIGGAMDEISATLNTGGGMWGDYDKALAYERERDASFDKSNPIESTALQAAGGVAGTLAGARMLGVPSIPKTMPGKVAAGGAIGGSVGAVEGFTRGTDGAKERMAKALESGAIGTAIGAAMPGVGYVTGKAWDKFGKPMASGLTTKGLKETGGDFIEQAKQSNIVMKPDAYGNLIDNIYRKIGPDLIPENMPKLNNSLKALEQRRGSVMPYSEVMKLREILKSSYDPTNPSQTRLMEQAIETLDDQIEALPVTAFAGSDDPANIAYIHKMGRDYYSRGKNAELMDNIIQNAKNATAANYTEAGFQTAIRQQLRGIAKDDFKKARWLKPEARQAILRAIGTDEKLENFLRGWGKFSVLKPGGLAKSSIVTTGATMMGGPPTGAAVAAILGGGGTIAKPVSDRLAKVNTQRLVEILMQGKPLPKNLTADELSAIGVMLSPTAGNRASQER